MSIWKNLNIVERLKESREISRLTALHERYSRLKLFHEPENVSKIKGFIAELDEIIASKKTPTQFSAYYLNALAGMARYYHTKRYNGCLRQSYDLFTAY